MIYYYKKQRKHIEIIIVINSAKNMIVDRQLNFEKLVLQKVNQGDIVHKVFLKPIQIMLKTNSVKVEPEYMPDEYVRKDEFKTQAAAPVGSLPQGLMIALKQQSIFGNTFIPVHIKAFQPQNISLKQMRADNTDNLLSFLKSKAQVPDQNKSESVIASEKNILRQSQNKLQLAICVCMYSESKTMLKDTIKGIEDNVKKIINSGVEPDSIAVIVVVDGIQKVNPTVIDYFQELQRQSFMFLGENNTQSYTKQDIQKQLEQTKDADQNPFVSQKFADKNMNTFLFDTCEIADREQRRFSKVYSYYSEFKTLKIELQKLRSNIGKVQFIYDKLPSQIQSNFFVPLAKAHKLKTAQSHTESLLFDQLTKEQIIQQYAYNPHLSKIIGFQSINKAIIYFQQYFQTREKLAYLGSFRKKIYIPSYESRSILSNPESRPLGQQHQNFDDQRDEDSFYRFMNLFMCIKYKNSGKLSSHNWFFNGFCKELNPCFTILLDVGLKPKADALYKMYAHMKSHPKVGGVCGYMSLKIQRIEDEEVLKDEEADWLSKTFLNFVDIQKAQQMEYHLAHILDKPFESAFKFIHVLPGAFSGYSMEALQPANAKDKLLKQYFKSIEEKMNEGKIKESDLTLSSVIFRIFFPQFLYSCVFGVDPESEEQMLYNQNIYLAEDRILCMEIHKNGKDLVFLPDAYAEVDPIKTVHGLMGQRKRWINGSYFAFEKVKNQKKQFEKQNKTCEIFLSLQIIYLNCMIVLGYFSVSLFYFTLHISMVAFQTDVLSKIIQPILNDPKTTDQILNFFVFTIDLIYAIIVGSIIFLSLNTASNKLVFKPYIYFASTTLGIMSLIIFLVLLIDMIRGLADNTSFLLANAAIIDTVPGGLIVLTAYRYVIVGMLGIYVMPVAIYSMMYCNLTPLNEILKSSISFIFYSPSYFVILNIYALCRIDDISWGTKGLQDSNPKKKKLQQKWKMIKLIHVIKFLIWNVFASVILLSFANIPIPRFYITFALMMLIILSLFLKIFVGLFYLIYYRVANSCNQVKTLEAKPSKMDLIYLTLQKELGKQILQRIRLVTESYIKMRQSNNRGSMIVALRGVVNNPKVREKDWKRFKDLNSQRSHILKRNQSIQQSRKFQRAHSYKEQTIKMPKIAEHHDSYML